MQKKTLLTFLYSTPLLIPMEAFSADAELTVTADTHVSEDRVAARAARSQNRMAQLMRMRERAQQHAGDAAAENERSDQQIAELRGHRVALENNADRAMMAVENQLEQCSRKATAAQRARCQVSVIEEAQENHQAQHEAFLAQLAQLGVAYEQRVHERNEASAIAEGNAIQAEEAMRRESELRGHITNLRVDDETHRSPHQARVPATTPARGAAPNPDGLVRTPQATTPARSTSPQAVSDITSITTTQKRMSSDGWMHHWHVNASSASTPLTESAKVRRCQEGVLAIQGWKTLDIPDEQSITAMIRYLNDNAGSVIKNSLRRNTNTTNVNTVCKTQAEAHQG